MRRRTLPVATALAVVFSSVALVATGAGSAAADSSTSLSLRSTGDMAVDGVHHRVFISDPKSGQIVVTDYAGQVVRTIGSLPGVLGLELSADSATLYAAVGDADAIVAVDTATATEAHRYSTGTADPQYLAQAGGKLWFGYGGAAEGNIGSLDLSGAEPVVTLALNTGRSWYQAPILDASPGAPDTLVAGAVSQSPVELAVYDVSSGTPTQTAYAFDPGSTGGGNLADLAVTPDGKDVVTASGAPYYQAVYKLTDLSKDGRYETNTYPNAVDIAPNGDVAAGTFSWYDPDVHVFKQGTTLPLRQYEFGSSTGNSASDTLAARGLAWAPDGSKLFAVSVASVNDTDTYTLHVYDDPTKTATTLTATAPATATRGKALTVKGTLTTKDDAAPVAGATVTLTRTDTASPDGQVLGTATVAADGTYTFTDTPSVAGKATYSVTYAGDEGHAGATASAAVDVTKNAVTLTATAPATATRGKALTVKGTLTSPVAFPTGTKVTVTRTDEESPAGKALGTATVAANGTYSFTDTPASGGKVTYSVGYAGDADHIGANASATVTVSKNATTLTVNNTGKVYAYGADVTFTAHLGSTYKNRTVEIWADPYGSDKPNTLVKKGTVNSSGNLTATLHLGRDTKVTAKFTGDSRTAALSATSTVYTQVKVSTALSGAYKTARAWNETYAYFHRTKDPVVTTTMTTYPGRKYQMQIQQYYGGAWHTTYSGYWALGSTGKDALTLDGAPAVNDRFRVRSGYVDTKSGDNVNATTYGAWKYLVYTK
ncbi:Ig-like domain repeat protein [Streptomyces sp. NPDC002265]|uniref:Ig-like domain repeat protein n=1 Tax=Streptomyces sp. NPDC002265 TaxID=3154415 RepID=UPI00332847A6